MIDFFLSDKLCQLCQEFIRGDFVFGKDYSLMPASDSVQCGVWASECLYVVSWLLSLPLHEFFRF